MFLVTQQQYCLNFPCSHTLCLTIQNANYNVQCQPLIRQNATARMQFYVGDSSSLTRRVQLFIVAPFSAGQGPATLTLLDPALELETQRPWDHSRFFRKPYASNYRITKVNL